MSDTPENMTAVVAVLSHQIGELKQTLSAALNDIRSDLRSHGRRLDGLDEFRIRTEEREKAEDRIRRAIREERESEDSEASNRVTLSLARWQLMVALITGIAIVAGGIVAVVQALS